MNEPKFKSPGEPPKPQTAIQGPTTIGEPSTALVPFTLDSEIAMTLQRLGVTLSSHNLSISKRLTTQDLLGLGNVLARVEERIQEIPQWLWGSFWNYSGFSHGERKALTEEPEWAGPSYHEWAHQGAAYELFLRWSSSHDIHTQNCARAQLLPRSYLVRAASAPPENQINLLDRCLSGEITSVRQLEDEIKGIRDSLPVPVPDSKSKAKRVTITDVEAQVEPEETPESSSEHADKLAKAKRDLEKNAELRDAIKQIRRHGGDKLADAILLGEDIDIVTSQIYALAQHAPADLAALAPKILEAKRYPLTTPEAALRNKLQALFGQALERVRTQLGSRADNCGSAFQKAIPEATHDELIEFIGFNPDTQADLSKIDPGKINKAIEMCAWINKDRRPHEYRISFREILALRAESTPSGQDQEQSAPPEPERSREELAATQRILAILCAGNNPDNLASWRRALAKVPTNDLLEWNRESDENVRKVAELTAGKYKHGVQEALRIVRDVIDNRTPLSHLKLRCNAAGGHWEHRDGNFLIVITRTDRAELQFSGNSREPREVEISFEE
jgi:hypothetical protein